MRIVITLIFLTVATASYADTYKWEDENGIHFTENANSIPKKYRAKALAEARDDITTTDPSVAHDVTEGDIRSRERESQEQAEAEKLRGIEQKREIAEKLSKIQCEGGIPGECGPGRKCVYNELSYFGKKEIIKGSGVCKSNAEADRLVAESNEQRRHQQLVNKLDDINDNIKNSDRKLDDIDNKADSIDRQLKWGGY
jgi:hypothetical protein